MLSDREREALYEIERRFWDEDPILALSLDAAGRRLTRDRRRYVYAATAAVAAPLGLFMLAVGLPSAALVFAAVAGWAWVARRRRIDQGRRHP
ncbi:PEP-CTERM protein-sorting domain-containing protein [Lentzea albidocapillata subsp. violacea]|uniref:PEP-CTERM protein-sorting domain-containing protein n=1 Tax=Lentzea albidocapillata subsp. violacea TaxID=128104 RepID=A0A1G8YPN3_9PSEU|nr:DUF3040 domain-containing protein [Lentzea albidocapillata]SDK04000.1 PEP-CTERM protein-sorting domain-containing protein [Lentzea albidocapillata subsp. violacea]